MSHLRRLRALIRNDSRLIGRDRFLVMMFAYMFVIAAILRWGLPWLDRYLAETGILPSDAISLTLAETYPVIVGYVALFLGAMLPGAIFGFLLLEEKESETLTALAVTPLPRWSYLLYRVGCVTLLAVPMIMGMILIMGITDIAWGPLLVLSSGAALTAPIAMLFFATFADNQVQGFALTKFAGLAGWIIPIGWYWDEPARWLPRLFPPFWISEAYWGVLESSSMWSTRLVGGIALQIALIAWLIHRFVQTTRG